MKRNLLFAAMTLIAAVWSLTASAQTDVTSTYLTNADFEASTAIASNLKGYGKDGTPYGFQAVDGWTYTVLNADNSNTTYPNSGMCGAVFAYGTEYQMQGGNTAAPAAGPTATAKNALGFLGVWSCGGYYSQEVTLPAGEYTLQIPIYNQKGTQANTSWTGFVTNGGTKYTCAINTAIGEWVTQTVEFTLAAETAGKICLGYVSTGGGSGNNPHIYYDGVTILYKALETVVKTELEAKIAEATAFNTIVNDTDLASAIADAQAVFDDDDATQEEVNTATSDLELALTQANTSHDRTYLITNPEFNDETNGWTTTTGAQNKGTATNQPFPNKPYWENWNGSAYTGKMYQKLTGLAEGRYALTIWAFVNNFDAEAQHVYGNNVQVSLTAGAPTQYLVSPISVIDGTLEIGLEQTATVANWMGIDEARLYYIGPLTAEDYKDGLITLISEAQALTDPNEASASALASAISAAEGVADDPSASIDDVKAAIEALGAAIDHSKGSIAAEEILPAMKAFTETTNFYTPEAYETYYGQWQAKYDAGELTETEARGLQDPNVGTTWRATNTTVDDLLMSVWDEEPLMWDSYHVNTWSTEGDTDGSDFKVPFIEYWTGNGNSLAEKTLTATIPGLTPGNYEVAAWVRVRVKDGVEVSDENPVQGITMQVGEGEAVNVCTGTQVGTSQLYLDTFTATGVVGDDGVLTFKFNVAADNNISWIAFKNLSYVKAVDPVELATAINWENNMRVTASDELLLTVTPSNLEENGYTTTEGMQVQYYIIIDSEDNRYFGENIKAPFTGEPISVDFTQVLDSESHPFVVEPSKYFGVIITDIALLDSEDAVIATTEETIQVTVVGASDLYAQAKELAADADAVAVGKLLAAIEDYEFEFDETALQAAVDQFVEDNKDVEKDETAKVATNGWKNFDGGNAGVCATQFAPAITTYDGRNAQLAEVFEGNGDRTGTIIYQDITGLQNGTYKVGFYGNAFSTSGRDGFACTMADGAEDVAYVFANDEREFIVAHIATSTTENNFRQFDVEVTDGTIRLGMGKAEGKTQSTNWHTMQIYQLTWFATAKEVYAADQTELAALLDKAAALDADGNKTNGKEALESAIAEGQGAMDSNMLNIPELEAIIANLKQAIADFTEANYFIDFAAGEYYIIDAETDLKIAAGNAWGTHGIVNEEGLDLTLTPNTETRRITIDSRVSNGGDNHYLGSNLYMDSPAAEWALDYQGFGCFITNGTQYLNYDESYNLILSDTPREWIIVTKEGVMAERMEELAEASEENPVDASFLIKDGNFNRNDLRREAWVVENCTNSNLGDGCTETNGNGCAESYHSTFTISQLVQGAPAGKYVFTAQGFYTPENAENAPVFFVNDKTVAFPVQTGSETDMVTASASFVAGSYYIDPIEFIVGEDGEFTVGVQGTQTDQWVIWDNFQLTYYGPAEETKYEIHLPDLAGATITTDPEGEAAAGDIVTIMIVPEEGFLAQSVQVLDETGTSVADVRAILSFELAQKFTFPMPAQDVFIDVTLVEVDPNDYTDWIVNADLTDTENKGFEDVDNKTKGIDGSGIVKVGSGTTFDFRQTIENLPAGVYVLTAQAAYRYGGSEQTEYDAINTEGTVTKYAQLYAEVGEDSYQEWVMNRWDGASETDYAEGSGSVVVNERYVPNSSAAVQAWFNNGQYVNTVEFTVPEDGNVTIGIRKTESPDAGDYTVIGPWTLYRIGDVNTEVITMADGTTVPVIESTTVNVVLEPQKAYSEDTAEFDTSFITEMFGIESMADVQTYWLDREWNATVPVYGGGTIDGWRNAEGAPAQWAESTNGMCVKIEDPASGIINYIGAHDTNFQVGDEYVADYAFVYDNQAVILNIVINFEEKQTPEIVLDFVGEINLEATLLAGVNYDQDGGCIDANHHPELIPTFDVAEVAEMLGVEEIANAKAYIVNADDKIVENDQVSDWWRDGEGNLAAWNTEDGFCAKLNSPASGQIDYVGTVVTTHEAGTSKVARFAVTLDDAQAVMIVLTINWVDQDVWTGIESLIADKSGEQTIYDLSGRRVRTITKGGMYIVNGKKVFVK